MSVFVICNVLTILLNYFLPSLGKMSNFLLKKCLPFLGKVLKQVQFYVFNSTELFAIYKIS